MALSVSLAAEAASVPMDYRLNLSEAWAKDEQRREAAGVPEEIGFRTKPENALLQIRARVAPNMTPGTVVADSGYSTDVAFREGLDELGLVYSVGIKANI